MPAPLLSSPLLAMHLMYYLSPEGKRVYTLKKESAGKATTSAHPARFSPDDKFSRQRVTLKKRCVGGSVSGRHQRKGPASGVVPSAL